MQKVLIANDLKPLLLRGKGFLDRTDIAVFFAATNDELLTIHVEHQVNLIVTKLDLPGHPSEEIFSIIRSSKDLGRVSLIMICNDDVLHRERSRRCGTEIVLTMPVDPVQLSTKVLQLLNVAPRQSYRVILNVSVEGKFRNRPFLCKTENVSATGMLIKTQQDLTPGDVISCSFYLPDGTKVSAGGEVARNIKRAPSSDGNAYGIRFTKISPTVKSAIEAFVERDSRSRT